MGFLTRRQFVKGALLAGAAGTLPIDRVVGANEDIRVGVIGLGGRGSHSASWFADIPGVRIAALADADRDRLRAAREDYPKAKAYTDLRDLLDQKDIDAVVLSLPAHWHTLASIWAMEAGKEVYVEKPYSITVWESRQVVEAARKHGRVVQVGTQQRSDPVQEQIKAFLDSGEIGKVRSVRAVNFGRRGPIGKRSEPLQPPESVEYDLWLGPARDLPMYRERFHYDWHWVWNTGTGMIGGWGTHIIDDVYNVVLRDPGALPRRFLAGGGRVKWDDAGEAPNAFISYFETDSVPLTFELRHLPAKPGADEMDHYRGIRRGYVVECEGGYYAGGRGGGAAYDRAGNEIQRFRGDSGSGHARNFIEAVRSRDPKRLNAEVGTIHYSNSVCLLGILGYRAGDAYDPETAKEAVPDVPIWQDGVDRFQAYLRAHGVDPKQEEVRLSRLLEIDREKETFVGSTATEKAKRLLTRRYREPFVVETQS